MITERVIADIRCQKREGAGYQDVETRVRVKAFSACPHLHVFASPGARLDKKEAIQLAHALIVWASGETNIYQGGPF
jgi:hypothetical protein